MYERKGELAHINYSEMKIYWIFSLCSHWAFHYKPDQKWMWSFLIDFISSILLYLFHLCHTLFDKVSAFDRCLAIFRYAYSFLMLPRQRSFSSIRIRFHILINKMSDFKSNHADFYQPQSHLFQMYEKTPFIRQTGWSIWEKKWAVIRFNPFMSPTFMHNTTKIKWIFMKVNINHHLIYPNNHM